MQLKSMLDQDDALLGPKNMLYFAHVGPPASVAFKLVSQVGL